ncbi:MAG: PQQ-binding-like beta-propeller repeat protein [Helicobacteraceae bacterium]|nr:PQQ-binding-like beta-propeller repeat protein [Helicobacteraceae bacterium]
MKIILIIMFSLLSINASAIEMPFKKYESSGAVVDLVIDSNRLYSATDASAVDIFDIKSAKILKTLKVDQITDFMGDIIDSKVYSVDVLAGKIMILSQGKKGFRRVHIYENEQMELIIPWSEKISIAKAKFIDKDTILLGTLGSMLIAYDITSKKIKWEIQASGSKFSNFALNETRDRVVSADESGDLKIFDLKDGSLLKELSGQNLDNVFQVAFKNSIIATAGQDRRAVIYNLKNGSAYYEKASFLIYSIGLSDSAKLAAYSSDEYNNVTLFNTSTKKVLGKFGDNKMTISNILFLGEDELFVACDSNTINLYKIKE